MIDISCKFYLQKNDVTCTTVSTEAIIKTPKVASNMQRFAYSSSFTPRENKRIINGWSNFRR